MKNAMKKFLCIMLVLAVIAGVLSGCAGGAGETSGTPDSVGETDATPADGDDGTAMGRYVEEEVTIPEELTAVNDIVRLEDGTIRLAGNTEPETNVFYKSSDNGATWEKEKDFPDEIKNGYVSSIDMTPSGETGVVIYRDIQPALYLINKDGELKKLDIELEESEIGGGDFAGMDSEDEAVTEEQTEEMSETEEAQITEQAGGNADGTEEDEEANVVANFDMKNNISMVCMTEDGKLIASDYNGIFYLVNPEDGSVERTFSTENSITAFDVAGNTLLLIGYQNTLEMYDITTGEPLSTDQVLGDELFKADMELQSTSYSPVVIRSGDEENSIYFCNKNGLYRHVMNGTVTEEVIDGNLSSIGTPGGGIISMTQISMEEFLMVLQDSIGMSKLYRYTYSKDTPSRPSKEITIYALEDNTEVRQAVSGFQKENPEYYVNFQVGMTGEDGVTAADALRTLNTDIMAGNGPDILLLDGMPIDSYIEKGLLADMSDIINEASEKEEFFENITGAYAKDGAYYAVPTRFGIPMIQADNDTIAASNDLKTLADRVVALREADADAASIVESTSPQSLAERVYQSYSPALMNEDGTLSIEKLQEFYTELAKMAGTTPPVDGEDYSIGGMEWLSTSIGSGVLLTLMDNIKVNIGSLDSIDDFNTMISANKKMENYDYGLVETSGNKVFVPRAMVGINSSSSKTEDAKLFVSYLFGKDAQKMSMGEGLPVNKAAFEESIINTKGDESVGVIVVGSTDGTGIELTIEWSTEEEFADLREIIESLDTPMSNDSVIKDVVLTQAKECMLGNMTPEEAAETVIQKVNLYLSE